jgi:K+-sensing histidine kinase KdpD
LGGKRPQPNPAERRYRIWTRLLLCLMLVAAAATLLDISPAIRILPDYLLLMFFCITLYYKERLIFFDVLLKRGAFLFFALVALGAFFVFRPVSDGKQWLVLAPLFLAAPWAYGLLSRAIDRVWLRRRHTAAEAEHLFVAAAQVADNEDDLRARAARTLTEIFEAPARIVSGAAPPSDDNAQWPIPAQADYLPPCDVAPNPLRAPQTAGGIAAPMGTHGWVCLGPRSNSMPYLSDDRSLLQSLARTLGVVLENVRFREQEQQLRHLATRAELKALRAQINPHFLFNALNAIAGLIQTRPELAEETVEQLAEVFRYTLRKSEKEWVRLDEEIEFVAAYLRVEQARFGARLHVDIAVAANAKPVLVPAMSIQPLVENAIKHGTSAVEGQGRVRLTVTLQDDDVCVEVRDNGPGFPAGFSLDAPENGHGLRNITERLKGYYGERGRLSWENVAEGCLVRLQIPRHAVAVAAPRTSN